ncbi:hypothetical protein LSAT2_018856, partial [Lamellibrachia satsuma]
VKRGFWYQSLLGIVDQYKSLLPPVPVLREALMDGGCSTVHAYVQVERLLMDYAVYSDIEGALQPAWRRADSSFSLATPEQIEEFCRKITKIKNENTLEAFFEECEKDRLTFGQATTIFARK